MIRKALLVCGILSSLVDMSADLVALLRWHGYSYTSQVLSELSAIGAPTRPIIVQLGFAYDALLIAFGAGIWLSANRNRSLHVVAGLLIAMGAIGFFWPPMHMRGEAVTLTDTLHIVWSGVTSLAIMLAMGFSAAAFGKRFRFYAIASIIVMFAFGALTGTQGGRIPANLPTPWVGAVERVMLGAYLLWVVVLAINLLRPEQLAPIKLSERSTAYG